MKIGKRHSTSNERIAQLGKIGFQWNSDSQLIFTMAWNEQLADILDFKQQWGHFDVAQKYAQKHKNGGSVKYLRRQ